jgi:hypothetical protein
MPPPGFEDAVSLFATLCQQLLHERDVQQQQLGLLCANRQDFREFGDRMRAQMAEVNRRMREAATAATAPHTSPRSVERHDNFRRRRAAHRKKGQPRIQPDASLRPAEEQLRRFFFEDDAVLPALRLHAGLKFADLRLHVEPGTQRFLFLPAPLGEFALRNGFDPERVLADEDKSCELIAAWYVAHIEEGGDPDPAIEAVFRRLDRH